MLLIGFTLHEQSLFTKQTSDARNYTIAYRHLNAAISGVFHYVQLDVTDAAVSFKSADFNLI